MNSPIKWAKDLKRHLRRKWEGLINQSKGAHHREPSRKCKLNPQQKLIWQYAHGSGYN